MMRDIIETKKRGGALDPTAFEFIASGLADRSLPDYQVAAWLMATWFNGLNGEETLALTRAMVASGRTLDWSDLDRPVVDKHSTGGVGDKTSIVLVPLVAAAGAVFVKMSGRGLGHTGGTLDKLEAIPGFQVDLSPAALRRQVREIGCALVGQSPDLVPADGALYALRDVTATFDSIPLIASSVMSKKLAAGAGSIVLDVKHGEGALLPKLEDAQELARTMVAIGEGAGRRVKAVLSGMDRPLGRAVGNALEIREAMAVLRGEGPDELWTLVRDLGAHLLVLSGLADGPGDAARILTQLREAGEGVRWMERLIEAQGGDPRVVTDPGRLPAAAAVVPVRAARGGRVSGISPRGVADVVLALGGGRRMKEEAIDPAVGVVLQVDIGDAVREDQVIAEIHAASPLAGEEQASRVAAAVRVGEGE